MGEELGLVDDGLGDFGVAVAAGEGGDAGGEVNVLHVVHAGHLAAMAFEEGDGRGIGVHETQIVQVGDVFGLLTHRL